MSARVVSVAEDVVPQYALTFTVHAGLAPERNSDAVSHRQTEQCVVRRVTKQHMARAFERAVSAQTHEDARFAELTTPVMSSQKQQRGPPARDIDDAVRQWLLRGAAAPSREEIVQWLLARMVLVPCTSHEQSEKSGDAREADAWSLLICGEAGAELQAAQVRSVSRDTSVETSSRRTEQTEPKDRDAECLRAEEEDSEDEEPPPVYSEQRTRHSSARSPLSVDADERSDTPDFDAADGEGDEHAAPESLSPPLRPSEPEAHERSAKQSLLVASTASLVSLSATRSGSFGPSDSTQRSVSNRGVSDDQSASTTKSAYTFEPTATRIHRRSSSARSVSALDPALTNEWTQDRRAFTLELHKSKRDIDAAHALQRKTDAIARARKQQLVTQSQRKLRAHDQRRDDVHCVRQLVSDTLEYHAIHESLTTQVKRTAIAATRERERITQAMRVALGRTERHCKGPVLGTGPLSQREIDAHTLSGRSDREADAFVYDLHGRRHAAADAGDVAALGVFDAAMRKIKRVLEQSGVAAFRQFDTNRSGTLSRDEFAAALQQSGARLTPEQARVLFDHFDPNASGEVDYGELLWGFFNRRAFLKKWAARKTKLSARETKLLFYQYDRTGRGALSLADFQLALGAMGFALTEAELRLLVLKFDANHDGFIDYHEFHAFVSSDSSSSGDDDSATLDTRDARTEDDDASQRTGATKRNAKRSSTAREQSRRSDDSVEQILNELRALAATQSTIRAAIHK